MHSSISLYNCTSRKHAHFRGLEFVWLKAELCALVAESTIHFEHCDMTTSLKQPEFDP